MTGPLGKRARDYGAEHGLRKALFRAICMDSAKTYECLVTLSVKKIQPYVCEKRGKSMLSQHRAPAKA